MSTDEVDGFLARAFCGRTATVGADGYPYVVPNLFIWARSTVCLHTAAYDGHFLTNVRHSDRVCFEVDEPGQIFPYGHVECDTSVSYRSVILFGRIRISEEQEEKGNFYQAFMAKYAPQDSWGREKDSLSEIGLHDRIRNNAGNRDGQARTAARDCRPMAQPQPHRLARLDSEKMIAGPAVIRDKRRA